MAQSGHNELPHSNFMTSYSQSCQGIPPPPSGLGFDPSHVRHTRFSPDIQQMHQFYLPIQNGSTANTSAVPPPPPPPPRLNNDQNIDAGEHQRPPGMLNFSNRHTSPSMGLPRFNSAPSSVLSNMTGMGNETYMNPEAEIGRCFPGGGFSSMDRAHGRMSKIDEPIPSSTAENDPDRSSRVVSSASRFKPLTANGRSSGMELRPRVGVDVMSEPRENPNSCYGMPSSQGTIEPRPSNNYPGRSTVISNNVPSETGAIHAPPRTGHGLFRHRSSPAGFLSQHVSTDEHDRLIVASSSGNSSEDGSYERQGTAYFTGYAWDEGGNVMNGSSNAAFSAKKRIRNSDEKYYAGSVLIGSQKDDALEHGTYFSLGPSTSPESIYIADKLSTDSVPCRARAKRGCATHPRSIAERVRRTKISDRMKKLQELVPNMDKQTNTAEMLDEAVEYVKTLQRRVQELTEARSKCKCTCKKKDG